MPSGEHPRYVMDTSALLAYAGGEVGADAVGALLAKARRGHVKLFVSFMSVMEISYHAFRAKGEDGLVEALAYVQELPLQRVNVNEELLALAAQIKGSARLSVADAWILATAQHLQATLVHKDPEFAQAKTAVPLQSLSE